MKWEYLPERINIRLQLKFSISNKVVIQLTALIRNHKYVL